MSDPAMDIAKYINALTGTWFPELKMVVDSATANNLFVHDMPNDPDFAVSVMRYEGKAPTETFGNPLHTRNPRIQVQVRHFESNVALDRAGDILRELVKIKDQTINGTRYQRVTAVGEPAEIGPDSKNRERATVNFQVSYYDTV